MRIQLVTDFYAPTIGGLEGHAARLAKRLIDLGHTVCVVTSATPDAPDDAVHDGVRVIRIAGWAQRSPIGFTDAKRPFPLPFAEPGLTRALRTAFDDFGPDVVHAHGWISIAAGAASSGYDHALVTTIHDSGLSCAKRVLFHRDIEPCSGPEVRKCLSCVPSQYGVVKGTAVVAMLQRAPRSLARVDAFVPVASFLGDLVHATRGLESHVVETIPNFIDDPGIEFAEAPRPEGVPNGRYVLFAGTLSRFKGLEVALETWKRHRPDAALVLAGQPHADTPSDVPDGVHVLENLPHHELLAALTHSELAILPSQFPEPSPTVVLEAMALATPVVASRIGGIPDLVDESTGILVDHDDIAGFGAAINQLLDDDAVRAAMGAAARSRSSLFMQDVIVDRIVAVYERCIDTRSAPHRGVSS